MRPYKVEHLMDSPDESPEDVFELTGVLVHSGTAESGHYYSFIRERPSTGDKENWVEFNDDCVSPWDPSPECMGESCFGGLDYRSSVDGNNLRFDKTWSAYMLFYQRSSVLDQQKQTLERSRLLSAVRLPIPPRLANHITMENELLMRKYCLYDPSHAVLVTKMLSNIKQINGGQCSPSHGLEKLALTTALNHLDQVIARTKDLPDFPHFTLAVRQICQSCAECSRDYLEWFCDCPETLRHLLVRNPDALVRNDTAASILSALNKVKSDAAYAYGFGDDEDSSDELEGGDPQLIQRVVKCINKLWDIFHTNCRAWPEYFGLLFSISKMGKLESALLLDTGFLRKTLDIVSADQLLPLGQQYIRMLNIISKRIPTRPVSFDGVISLLQTLMKTCDPSLELAADNEPRLELALSGSPIPFTVTERHMLIQHWTRTEAHILTEKLLQINQNHSATKTIIVDLMHWRMPLDHNIYQAIAHGIRKGISSIASGPFLRAALIYCEESEEEKAIPFMIQHVSKVAYHVDSAEGKDFLQFFKDVLDLPANKSETPQEDILKLVIENVIYWGPGLLTYYDSSIRLETETFIREMILNQDVDIASGASEEEIENSNLIVATARRLGVACLEYLQDTYIRQRQQAVRATLLNIHVVIDACAEFFDENSKDPITRRFIEQRASTFFHPKG
jgi:ubiquitin carboxyl-terminal hydrolase 34